MSVSLAKHPLHPLSMMQLTSACQLPVELSQHVGELQVQSVYPASETAHQELVQSMQRSLQEAANAAERLRNDSR